MPEKLLNPVVDRSAWKGSEFAHDDSWIYRLSPAEIEEIDSAVSSVRRRKLKELEFGIADFPLPTLGARLRDMMEELEFGRGFVMLRGLPVADYGMETLRIVYWGLGVHLGEPVTQNLNGDLIARIMDFGYDVKKPDVKPSQTNAEQNPHCDPADVVALLCVRPAIAGGVSRIVSSTTIYNEILANHPDYLDILYRGFHHDLRGDHSENSPLGVSPHKVPVYSYFQERLSCVFNIDTIKNAQPKMGVSLPRNELDAIDYMVSVANRPDVRLDMSFEPGDIQLLNNYSILHCRSAFTDHSDPDKKRLLLRLWLKMPNARPLAPEFARGYITGARTGAPGGGTTPQLISV